MQFSADSDWVFASPLKIGYLLWSYPWGWRVFTKAAKDAGIGKLGTHTMRHSYRSWLDAVGTPVAVQQKLMRHTSITTTMNIYGDVVTDEMAEARSKVFHLALATVKGFQRGFTARKLSKIWRREADDFRIFSLISPLDPTTGILAHSSL